VFETEGTPFRLDSDPKVRDIVAMWEQLQSTLVNATRQRLNIGHLVWLMPLLWLTLASGISHAQSISITPPDATNWPLVAADIIFLDRDGSFSHPATGDVGLTENGITLSPALSCPDVPPATPVSLLVLLDRSGSMNAALPSGTSRLDAVKGALAETIRATRFVAGTAVAITAFDAIPSVVSDFMTSPNPIITALNRLDADGATEYNPSFLDGAVGGISLLATRPAAVPRVMIFISDGEPNSPPGVDSIVAASRAAGVIVHCITLGAPLTGELRTIASSTGGTAYGDVDDEATLRALLLRILLQSQGGSPCRVTWTSPLDCDRLNRNRSVTARWIPEGVTTTTSYLVPAQLTPRLEADLSLLWFGPIAPPVTATRQVVLTARRSSITISGTSFPLTSPFSVVDWGGSPPPFVLADGESRTITIMFAPPDSSAYGATLPLLASPCPAPIIGLSGGRGSSRHPHRLALLTPVGGERFDGCDDVDIRWGGVAPTTPVRIEASSDDGTSWWRVADSATGLRYLWHPPGNGSGYRVRISISSDAGDTITTVAGGGSGSDGPDARLAELLAPTGLARQGDIVYIAESSGNRVRRVDLASGAISTVAGTGSYGFSNDGGSAITARMANPTDVLLVGRLLYITDFSNHRVRTVDLTTGTISTFAGDGTSGFGGDGGPATSAQFFQPSHLAANGAGLYICDRGNNRIRRVDFLSRRITTVAGGGSNPEGDGESALAAILVQPSGITIEGDTLFIPEEGRNRVRAVDLRNGTISTVVGTGTLGFSGDGGISTSAQLNRPTKAAATARFLVVADKRNNRIRLVDRKTRRIRTLSGGAVAGFSGDNGPPENALLNAPEGLDITDESLLICDVANNRVREIRFGDAGGRDSSRSSFAVTTGVAVVDPGDSLLVAPTAIGSVRDTILVRGLCNRGDGPLVIDSVWSIGANRSEFRVVSGLSSNPIPPGTCRPIEIRFTPTAIGQRRGAIVIHSACGGFDTLNVVGSGVASCGLAINDRIDLGSVDVGSARSDSIVTQVICNRGSSAVSGVITLRPTDVGITIVDGAGPFTLLPGACHDVTLRFAPLAVGAVTARLDYTIADPCNSSSTLIVARGRGVTSLTYPTPIDFGSILCYDTMRDTTIIVRNRSTTSLAITKITLIANDPFPNDTLFSIRSARPSPTSPWQLAPAESRSITIRYSGGTIGVHSAAIEITTDDGTLPQMIDLRARRDSIGLAPLAPVMIFDGTLPAVNYPLTDSITLYNSGTLPITITQGDILGGDSARFLLPSGQLPKVIAPGDTFLLRVTVLKGAEGIARRARLELTGTPTCEPTTWSIDLIENDGRGLLLTSAPRFAPLLCLDDSTVEATVTLRNLGGAPLVITGASIDGVNASDFILLTTPPIVIPPSGSTLATVRFIPSGYGRRTARLLLVHDGGGDSIVPLEGWRGSIAIGPVDTLIDFGDGRAGIRRQRTLRLRNSGRDTARLLLPMNIGPFRLIPSGEVILPPSSDSVITFEFPADTSGIFQESLNLSVIGCNSSIRLRLRAGVLPPLLTLISLPTDSGRAGRSYQMALRRSTTDPALLAAYGPLGFRARLRFNATVLWPRTGAFATLDSLRFDPSTRTQTLVVRGTAEPSADTIALIRCDIPIGGEVFTLLTIDDFAWDDASITDSLVDGSFTVSDSCAVQPRLKGVARITKIRPIPTQPHGSVAEIDLNEELELQVDLIDMQGRRIATIFRGRRGIGAHEIPLALEEVTSGFYTLEVRTPYSIDRRGMILVR
jgi:hypothetical protein